MTVIEAASNELIVTGTVENGLMDALRLPEEQQEVRLRAVQQLTAAHPTDFRVWWALANVSQQRAEIRAALLEALRLNPDLDEAREKLRKLEQGRGRLA